MTADLGALDDRTARKLARRAAKAAARRAERAEREDEKRRRRAARHEERRRTQATRALRRTEHAAALATVARRLRPVAPLLVVTGFAMYGQIGYGVDHYSDPATPFLLRLLVAIGAAIAVESIALTVQWHAHDALLLGATATAARLRRASYLIALAVAGVNYAHFAGEGLAPTPGAIVFALFSASGPWLWGLHTRRAQRLQLLREGQVDSAGAVFSAERWRSFPLRTWAARRWSIDRGITHPREAWEGYRAHREQRRVEKAATRELQHAEKAAAAQAAAEHDDTDGGAADEKRGEPSADLAVLAASPVTAEALAPIPQPSPRQQRRRPAHRDARPVRGRSELLADPPQIAIDVVRSTTAGWPTLIRLLAEKGITANEYEAKGLIRQYRTSEESR